MVSEAFPYNDPSVRRGLSIIYGIALLELAMKESEESRKKNTEGQVFSTHF
jgi:hypothetical protein